MRPVRPPDLAEADLVEALARLARAGESQQWLSRADRAHLERSTGLLGPHLHEALRRAFRPFHPAACRRLVRQARLPVLPDPRRVLLAILAGPLPAVATGVLFPALAARFAVRLRPSAREPFFPRLLASLVAREAPELAPSVGIVAIPSGDPRLDREVRQAPVVLAYGSDETLIRLASLRPGRPLLGGGHRESLVWLDQASLGLPSSRDRLADAVARDVCLYDQAGCLSPSLLLLEPGPLADPFLERLRASLARRAQAWPVAPPDIEALGALRLEVEALRDHAARTGGRLWSPPGALAPTLAVLPPGQPPLRPSPGRRVLQVLLCPDLADLPGLVPDLAGHLQGMASTWDASRIRQCLPVPFQAPFLCRPGRLQDPPAGWPENGRPLHRALAAVGSPGNPGGQVTQAGRRR